jgi:hypothetical protein
MGYRFRFQDDQYLLVIVFEGEISYEEEVRAVLETLADPRMRPNLRILVDKSRAKMTITSEDVGVHVDLIRRNLGRFGTPKVANVVARASDFGMTRMFELRAEGEFQHDFMVFRGLEEACAWLGVELAAIQWPE